MQDREASESVVTTPWSGGGNMGARGHDAGHLSLLLFRDESTWFSRLVIEWLVYMHDIVHIAYTCELM